MNDSNLSGYERGGPPTARYPGSSHLHFSRAAAGYSAPGRRLHLPVAVRMCRIQERAQQRVQSVPGRCKRTQNMSAKLGVFRCTQRYHRNLAEAHLSGQAGRGLAAGSPSRNAGGWVAASCSRARTRFKLRCVFLFVWAGALVAATVTISCPTVEKRWNQDAPRGSTPIVRERGSWWSKKRTPLVHRRPKKRKNRSRAPQNRGEQGPTIDSKRWPPRSSAFDLRSPPIKDRKISHIM